MCTSRSLFLLYRVGWIGGGGGVLLGDDGIKPTDNQVAGCLKNFRCSDFFFFYKLYNTNLSLTLQQNYFYNKVMFFH